MFTKNDLKSGMVVEVRCGKRYLAVLDPSNHLKLIRNDGCLSISNFNENLENEIINEFDITKVFKPLDYLSFSNVLDCRSYMNCWYLNGSEEPQPEEMTLEEICKALGKDVKIVKEH